MNIAVVGMGYVGNAVAQTFSNYMTVYGVDPKKPDCVATIKDLPAFVDGVVISVPTPQGTDGSCDMSIVYQVLADCPKKYPILIKSTISIEGWKEIKERFPTLNITFSPEFLTAANAEQDFRNSKYAYLAHGDTSFWTYVLRRVFGDEFTVHVDEPEVLIISKYLRNCFLATKVSFFNQAYDLCKNLGIDYENVKQYAGEDARIGHSHTAVTKERGFGGACFPKDTQALLKIAENAHTNLTILRDAVEYNKWIRHE